MNEKEYTFLGNLNYKIQSEVDKENLLIKIRESGLRTITKTIIDLKDKEVIESLKLLGWIKNKWQEEFEDTFIYTGNNQFMCANTPFDLLYDKYIGVMCDKENNDNFGIKVKIKCKDGLIQIERIDY